MNTLLLVAILFFSVFLVLRSLDGWWDSDEREIRSAVENRVNRRLALDAAKSLEARAELALQRIRETGSGGPPAEGADTAPPSPVDIDDLSAGMKADPRDLPEDELEREKRVRGLVFAVDLSFTVIGALGIVVFAVGSIMLLF
ncbi:hypothetical protein NI17_006650 [Thermobifida halotolerans]|uniref:Uncharacterized protein n=1 Tax=Thermobifida halotolerans TaxID=483545 RepID=A0A399G634_9ACTN|nr:hypothetical protein [Thermobifida halotolerans]UOE20855.1 hypothetical protein NI17_006650 [Thermobifida halotolerans]